MPENLKTYIAFFDLDGTILNTSSGLLYIRYLKDRNMIRFRDRVRFITVILLYRLRLLSANGAIAALTRPYRGVSLEETLRHNDALFDEYIKGTIRREAVEEIDHHNRNGGITVMLSASTNFICRKVVEHLGMADMLCTELEEKDGMLTGRLSRPYCHGKEKLRRAREFCSRNGHDLSTAWYYADSLADMHVMETVANPRCVTPDKKLRRLALDRGWPLCDWE